MKMLLVTDGSAVDTNTVQYGALIAKPAAAAVTLLGIAASAKSAGRMADHLLTQSQTICEGSECTVETRIVVGPPEIVTLEEIDTHPYQLVVIGAVKRRGLRRFLYGSASRYLAQHVPVPLLVVNRPRNKLEKILVCTSAENPGETDAYVGGTIAALIGARVTILHVMSQIALVPSAPDDLEEDATTLMERRAREGIHLTRTLEILGKLGIPPEKRIAKVRHGLVVDEIVGEAREHDYDLVVMGAHGVPEDRSQRGLRTLLQENITDQILTELRRPMLIVRSVDEDVWKPKS
jgi:nucleotide-binding universal stress UspA family protein